MQLKIRQHQNCVVIAENTINRVAQLLAKGRKIGQTSIKLSICLTSKVARENADIPNYAAPSDWSSGGFDPNGCAPKEIATKLVLDASAAQPAPFSDDHERRPVIGRIAFVDRHQNGVSEGFGPRQF